MSQYNFNLLQLIIFGLFSSSLNAEDENSQTIVNLDTMLVTGAKPAVDFPINAPLNLTQFDRETINELGFSRAQDVASYVPNYNLIDAGANGFGDRSNIRGLTNAPGYTTPSVVMYVDDVPYLASIAYANQLLGVDSIDVYRGPQGGLFGRNSYAGVIKVKSRRPGNQLQGNVSLDKGNYDSLNIDSYFAGALVKDLLYFSLGTAYSKRNGYLDNTFLNSNPDSQEHKSGRVSLLWTPNTEWEVDFSATLQDFDDGVIRGSSLLSNDIFQTQSGERGNLNQDGDSQALKISYHKQHFEVLSVTARRKTDTKNSLDFDFLPQPFVLQENDFSQQQWSQEFRFKSFDVSAWRWSFGLFFSDNNVSGSQINTVFGVSDALQLKQLNENAYAVFAQISYQGIDKLRMFLDIRLDYVEKEIDSSVRNLTGKTTFLKDQNSDFFVSPKITLEYAFDSQLSAYLSTGLAFRPGGFSAQSEEFPQYKKETLWASEVGIKSNWLNNRINADLAIFYYDIENYQLEETFSPFDYTVINAPKVASYGAELDLGAKITDTVKITGNFAYTHIEFNDYTDAFTGVDYQGKNAPYVPMFNINIAGKYKHPSGLFARTDLLWTGKTYFDAANSSAFSEQDYTQLNVRLGYEKKYFSIYGYANNLSDSKYFTYKITRINFGTPSEPRTFGARIDLKF